MKPKDIFHSDNNLFTEISAIIEQSRTFIAEQANSTLAVLFWQIGNKINRNILENKRASYGKQIVVTLSRQLTEKYGNNFQEKNLRRMLQFAEKFEDFEKVATLSRHLSWSHFLILIPLKSQEAKDFYAKKTIAESLGVRDLRKSIASKSFERTDIANLQISNQSQNFQNTFKDPYFLEFLGLKNTFLEKDLEEAILRDLEHFILELGKGFSFVERQKRMIIDGEDFYLDLLFYHRKLKRLIAIELKLGKFEAKYKGQMELYLKWLNKYEKVEGEETPVGLILCAESSREQIELLEMHKDGIVVAEYWTELPSKKDLEIKIHNILTEARERLQRNRIN